MSRMPIDDHSKLGLRVGCELGNLERNTLFSEVLIGAKPLAGSVACNSELNAPGTRTLTISHEDVDAFVNRCAMFLKKDSWFCMCADGGWNGIRLLQFDSVILEPRIRDALVTYGNSLKGDAICAGLQPGSWEVNFDFGARIG